MATNRAPVRRFQEEDAKRLEVREVVRWQEVVDEGEALGRAASYARRIASLRPEAVQATKRVLNQWLRSAMGPVLEHGLALEFMLFPDRLASPDRAEGSS